MMTRLWKAPLTVRLFPRILKWAIVAGAVGFVVLVLEPRDASANIAKCNATAAQAAAPPGMMIAQISDLISGLPATTNGIADIPADALGPGSPETCLVTGYVVTDITANKTANFSAVLPAHWNGKFMFNGCGGNCGEVGIGPPSVDQLSRGYAAWSTDGGHAAPVFTDTWAVTAPGEPNTPALLDFYFRAQHVVTELGKAFTSNFYSGRLTRSYFMGCSDGGRDGMEALAVFPQDFDGVIAGDPYFDIRGETLNGAAGVLAELRSNTAALTQAQYQLASTQIIKKCDALDGVQDGLIQNPQVCTWRFPMGELPSAKSIRVLLDQQLFEQVEAWRRRQPEIPSTSESVRKLLTRGLEHEHEQHA
jgi:feruloyl esterase